MKLAVISPESHDPREAAVVRALFAAGLDRYHLRKPGWSVPETETFLENFSPAERSRMVIHSHYALASAQGMGGIHDRDTPTVSRGQLPVSPGGTTLRSRACHDLPSLREALGRYDAVLLSPIFPSISKPGHIPDGKIDFSELKTVLSNRSAAERRTLVFALGGIDATNTERCRQLGFDGIAVLGALWGAEDPVRAFQALKQRCAPAPAIMCLTQDGLRLSHAEQARQLCEAGARWVQLRMKDAQPDLWLETAHTVRGICQSHGAIFIVNDSVDVALKSGADGVHLGKTDLDWHAARRLLGPDRILGGTVNNFADAQRARDAECLSYVGVGPWRFTPNKKNLAPVLGAEGVRALIHELKGIPAWVIGGIEVADLVSVQATGATGVAVSSALYRGISVVENFMAFQAAWPNGTPFGTEADVATDRTARAAGAVSRVSRSASSVTTL